MNFMLVKYSLASQLVALYKKNWPIHVMIDLHHEKLQILCGSDKQKNNTNTYKVQILDFMSKPV